MAISRSIVEAVRSLDPPGRFLDKNPLTGLWSDIGHKKAIEKTSQALRDGAATLRKQLSADLGDPDFLNDVFAVDVDDERVDAKIKPLSTKSKVEKAKDKENNSSSSSKSKSTRPKVSLPGRNLTILQVSLILTVRATRQNRPFSNEATAE